MLADSLCLQIAVLVQCGSRDGNVTWTTAQREMIMEVLFLLILLHVILPLNDFKAMYQLLTILNAE